MRSAPRVEPRLSPWPFVREERGSVTAEFAIVLPLVVGVLGLVIAAISLASHSIGLVSLSAEVARLEARGDSLQASNVLGRAMPGTRVARENEGGLLCVTMRAQPAKGLLSGITISATSCAARTDVDVMSQIGHPGLRDELQRATSV